MGALVGNRGWRTVSQEAVLSYVAQVARAKSYIEKIVLFGSRAKGTARPFSDYDLAVKLTPGSPEMDWLAFKLTTDENAPTLCKLSLVEWTETMRPELAANIAKDGIVVYER